MAHDWTPPPPPPKGPECRVECSSCGYSASKTEFNEVHGPTCKAGARFITAMVATIVVGIVILIISKFIGV